MLTRAVGFRYAYNAEAGQFAHASGIMVATPDGRLSHYFYGIEYGPRDLRLALIEAVESEDRQPPRISCSWRVFTTTRRAASYSIAVMTAVRRGRASRPSLVIGGSGRDDAKAGAERATPVATRAPEASRDWIDRTPREHMEPSHPVFSRAGLHDGVPRGQPVFLHAGDERFLRRGRHRCW